MNKPDPTDYGAEIRHDGTVHWPEDADFDSFCFACEELDHGCVCEEEKK